MLTEADTCRKYVLPMLQQAGWDDPPFSIAEQRTFTDGRVIVHGNNVRRGPQKRADYLLRYRHDYPIAVVEAKAAHKHPADGLQQARSYAEILDLPFAYSTNGHGIVEFDFLTGHESAVDSVPSPEVLFSRVRESRDLSEETAAQLLTPLLPSSSRPRYYQHAAIVRTVEAILNGHDRLLLTMATGTGKTTVAFHICWKLWKSQWTRSGLKRRPRILYLADRRILVDDPMDKEFAPFGDARFRIENGRASKSRELYFGLYQSLFGGDSHLFRQFAPDFFDLIIVDECHRGSARDDSQWREVLDYFTPAAQLGMTATPLREDNRNTYSYFGHPIYTYSLRQGIDDGFLAPYKVHRVQTDVDAVGWRPTKGETDVHGREIPDRVYGTADFDRSLVLRERTTAIARHLASFMAVDDPLGKTIVFCVDQEHATQMRQELANLNAERVQTTPDFVCRVTSDEGDIGRQHLSRFQDIESTTPVILTTSKLLTTGIDAPTCRNVVLARVVGSMTEFKQIIGRGTRLRDDYGKYFFNIIDYTGSATTMFADPDFDGDPIDTATYDLDEPVSDITGPEVLGPSGSDSLDKPIDKLLDDSEGERRKLYVDGGSVEITAHLVYELDEQGRQLRVVSYTAYAAEEVRRLFSTGAALRQKWQEPEGRQEIIRTLQERGIDLPDLLSRAATDVDPFDLLCNLAFSAPLRTRRERADRVRKEEAEFWARHNESAREVLEDLLQQYMEHGVTEFEIPEVLKVPPISSKGNVAEIARLFGGAHNLRQSALELQELLYAA